MSTTVTPILIKEPESLAPPAPTPLAGALDGKKRRTRVAWRKASRYADVVQETLVYFSTDRSAVKGEIVLLLIVELNKISEG